MSPQLYLELNKHSLISICHILSFSFSLEITFKLMPYSEHSINMQMQILIQLNSDTI